MKQSNKNSKALENIISFLDNNPEIKKKALTYLNEYGVLSLSGKYSAECKEDLIGRVKDLLFRKHSNNPLDIHIRSNPSRPDNWSVEYNVLRKNKDKGYIRAVDYEKDRF